MICTVLRRWSIMGLYGDCSAVKIIIALLVALLASPNCLAADFDLALDSKSESLWLMGTKYEEEGNLDKALECYNQAASVREDARFYNAIGRLYEQRKELEKSKQYYEK